MGLRIGLSQLKYKPDFERARRYWDAFWVKELIDRPCCILHARKDPDGKDAPPRMQPADSDFDSFLDQWEIFLTDYVFLAEYMPYCRPGFGPDQMAAFLGAPLETHPNSSDTSWSQKVVNDWDEFLPLELREDNYYWSRMKEFHRRAEERFRGQSLLANIDLHSNIDALEGLRGAQRLLFDIIDTPALVLKAMQQVRHLYRTIYNELFMYGNKVELGSTSGLKLYSRGKTDMVQADFICLLSPDLFRTFALPAIEEEVEMLDHSCFHLDGPDALKHLDAILAIEKLDAVQWAPGAGNRPGYDWPEVIHHIQEAGKSAVLYGTVDEIKTIHSRYKANLLVYDVQASSTAEAEEFLEWLVAHT